MMNPERFASKGRDEPFGLSFMSVHMARMLQKPA